MISPRYRSNESIMTHLYNTFLFDIPAPSKICHDSHLSPLTQGVQVFVLAGLCPCCSLSEGYRFQNTFAGRGRLVVMWSRTQG